jgi:hypothetical protein
MADHGRTERLEGFFADLDGTGNVEFDVCHKLFVNFFTSLRARQVLLPRDRLILVILILCLILLRLVQ